MAKRLVAKADSGERRSLRVRGADPVKEPLDPRLLFIDAAAAAANEVDVAGDELSGQNAVHRVMHFKRQRRPNPAEERPVRMVRAREPPAEGVASNDVQFHGANSNSRAAEAF